MLHFRPQIIKEKSAFKIWNLVRLFPKIDGMIGSVCLTASA